MTLRKRIGRLECRKNVEHEATYQLAIYRVCPDTREYVTAKILDGETLIRRRDESETLFTSRVCEKAETTVLLPDNGRD